MLAAMAILSNSALAADQTDGERIKALEDKVDALTQELERSQYGDIFTPIQGSKYGLGPAASKVYFADQGLSIGGYGEALYQNPEGDESAQADFLRAILYFGYKFSDKWVLNTEIEIEHADEVFLEFGYLDYLHSEALNFRAGMMLIPMGLVNELHEPTSFLSARRSDVESVIIPTTWRENGIGIFGDLGQVSYRAYVVNGLDGKDFSSKGLRGGRQKGSKASAEDLAFVGRLDWEPTAGILLGGSYYDGGSGQELGVDADTRIIEGHADLRRGPFQLRALYTQAELKDVAALNRLGAEAGTADLDIESIGETLSGWYVELGMDISDMILGESEISITPFIRVEEYNTQEDIPAGFKQSGDNDVEIVTVGINVKPIHNIVFKADYQIVDTASNSGTDQLNLAMGYEF
jgi:hypothetical protein